MFILRKCPSFIQASDKSVGSATMLALRVNMCSPHIKGSGVHVNPAGASNLKPEMLHYISFQDKFDSYLKISNYSYRNEVQHFWCFLKPFNFWAVGVNFLATGTCLPHGIITNDNIKLPLMLNELRVVPGMLISGRYK